MCCAVVKVGQDAARIGISLKGCAAYVTWPPCTRCARSLVQAGVEEVLYPGGLDIPERWREDFDLSNQLFKEAGMRVRPVPMPG